MSTGIFAVIRAVQTGPSLRWHQRGAAIVLMCACCAAIGCEGGEGGLGDAAALDARVVDARVVDADAPHDGSHDGGDGGAAPVDAAPDTEAVYFVVAEMPGLEQLHDAYILPVRNPEDIAHARDLVQYGPAVAGRPIAVAKVRIGADGVNCNPRADGEPLWSWHVVELLEFADWTIELIDGTPTLLEEDPAFWMSNTPPNPGEPDGEGTIGFWGYTVVEEMPGELVGEVAGEPDESMTRRDSR